MYEHILIPTDGSKLANKAVAEGVKLAKEIGARLTFLSVLVPFSSLGDYDHAFSTVPEPVRRQALAFLEKDGRTALETASSIAKSAGVVAEALCVEDPHPYEAIIRVASSKGADLIVIASHGRSGAGAVLLGSVTQKVLSHTQMPVLVVR